MMAAIRHDGQSLAALLRDIAFVDPVSDCVIEGLSLDSREVKPGDCFIAISGEHCHGAEFAHAAVAAGARAVLVEDSDFSLGRRTPVIRIDNLRSVVGEIASRFYDNPSSAIDVFAVTGTNGKTTVAYLLAHALKTLRGAAGYAGTLGIGELDEIVPSANTTPDPLILQGFFAQLRDHRCTAAAIEVSSHGIAQGRINGTIADVAVFTNLSHDHLDFHVSMEAYAKVKKSLFRLPGLRHAVINIDDPVGREIVRELDSRLDCWTYSAAHEVAPPDDAQHVHLKQCTSTRRGSELVITTPSERVTMTTPLIGDFNALNVIAALAALIATGLSADDAAFALSGAGGVSGRMELLERKPGEGAAIVVDYAHTPESLARALAALRPLTPGRLICVFGCGGDRDETKRPAMGRAAELGADAVIVTSDNPRSENNSAIVEQIIGGMRRPHAVNVIHDRQRAIKCAIDYAGPDDVVLLAGKGHEPYQEINGRRLHFSDREAALACLTGALP